MRRTAFLVTNPDVEFSQNFVFAVAELHRQRKLSAQVLVHDSSRELPGVLRQLGVGLEVGRELHYFDSPGALADGLGRLRAEGGLERLCFAGLDELFFHSFLSLNQDLPHVVYDIHILGGMQAFLASSGHTPKSFRRLLEERALLLRVFHIFPGFEYLYQNYGFPEGMLAFCPYSLYLPHYRERVPRQPYAYAAGNHMRDYDLLARAARDLDLPIRIRTNDVQDWLHLRSAQVELLGKCDYGPFTRETAAARFVVLPLKYRQHISCGLSFLAHAMALGKAIVTTRCPSTEGYIEDEVTGLLVPPHDARALRLTLGRLLEDETVLPRLERAVSEHVRRHMDLVANLERMLAPARPPDTRARAAGERKAAFLRQVERLPMQELHREWLPPRRAARDEKLAALRFAGPRKLLLVNATKGQQFYPSITDFFALLSRHHPQLQASSASFFDIAEFKQQVAEKGLEVLPVEELGRWDDARLNRFDFILFVGPSELMAALMSRPGLRSRLACLDLAFYHRLIELDPRAFFETKTKQWPDAPVVHRVQFFSCQSVPKVAQDLAHCFDLGAFDWRWFNYIPIGFDYASYYRSDTKLFDVALLGTAGRDYARLASARLNGRKIVLLPGAHGDSWPRELAERAQVFVAPRVDERLYARLLALARCVILPLRADSANVFLSVNDALASGLPLLTCRHPGAERILAQGAPLVLYDPDSQTDLFDQLERVLRGGADIDALAERGVAFARAHLDIYNVLFEIARELARQGG